jgi:hypothetical protein
MRGLAWNEAPIPKTNTNRNEWHQQIRFIHQHEITKPKKKPEPTNEDLIQQK